MAAVLVIGIATSRAGAVEGTVAPSSAGDTPPAPAGDDSGPIPPPSPRWGAWRPDRPHSLNPKGVYTRVDGAHLGATWSFEDPERPNLPRLSAELGYAFARERLLYGAGIEQPLAGGRFVVGARGWRLTRSFEFDDEIVGNLENTAAALLVQEDYREYFEGRGGEVSATWNATDKYALSGTWLVEESMPLEVKADWALLSDGPFRPNPAAGEGTLRSITATLRHDSRPEETERGVPFMSELRRANRDWVRLTWETAGSDLGGDFDYTRAQLDARGYWKLTPQQFFSARLLAGRGISGRLPVQKEFYAGGISTLRGHAFKEYRGDRQVLFNAEYAVDLLRAAQGLVFTDVGRAWDSAEHPDGPRFPIDVGVGIQTRDERLRLHIAKDTRDGDAPVLVTVRTKATF